MSDELVGAQLLSEATAVLQAMAWDGIRIDDTRFERYVNAVITEYDRRGRVEKAAAALVEHHNADHLDFALEDELFDKLRDALNGDQS